MAAYLVSARQITCSLLLAALPAAAALGAVTGVATTPAAERVALTRATSLSLSWNVTTNTTGSVTISSAAGQFRTPTGALLGTVTQPLTRTVTGPTTTTLTETVLVSADVIERARREGHDHVVYRRSFTDGVAASGEIKLYAATAKSAAFGVSRIAVGFDGGEAVRVIGRGEEVRVRAEVSYTGGGLLRARWEIAGPNPDAEKPVWRALNDVTRPLAAGDTVTLASPTLPTGDTGLYLVRMQVTDPRPAFGLPVARYTVRQE